MTIMNTLDIIAPSIHPPSTCKTWIHQLVIGLLDNTLTAPKGPIGAFHYHGLIMQYPFANGWIDAA